MVALNSTKTEELPDSDFPEIPTGEYKVLVKSIDEALHKKIPQKYLKVRLEILEGDYANKPLFDQWYGLIPGTSGAFVSLSDKMNIEKSSLSRFKSLLKALDISNIDNTNILIDKIVTVKARLSGGFTNIDAYETSASGVVTNTQHPIPDSNDNSNNTGSGWT